MLWIIILALSATVDSWAVGMTYKAQKIKIPLAAKGMISLVSGMTALIAVLFGRLLSEILPIAAIQASGGTLLAVMGVKALWQIKKEKEKDINKQKQLKLQNQEEKSTTEISEEIKSRKEHRMKVIVGLA